MIEKTFFIRIVPLLQLMLFALSLHAQNSFEMKPSVVLSTLNGDTLEYQLTLETRLTIEDHSVVLLTPDTLISIPLFEIGQIRYSTMKVPTHEHLTGDVNNDYEVNISDINAIIKMILNGSHDPRGDVNEDGEINVRDLNNVIDIILIQTTILKAQLNDNHPFEVVDNYVSLGAIPEHSFVSLFNADGDLLMNGHKNAGDNINISGLPAGSYLVRVNQETYKITKP
jgi:hypothetical protein